MQQAEKHNMYFMKDSFCLRKLSFVFIERFTETYVVKKVEKKKLDLLIMTDG